MNRIQSREGFGSLRLPRGGREKSDTGKEGRGQDARPERSRKSQERFTRRAVRGLHQPANPDLPPRRSRLR